MFIKVLFPGNTKEYIYKSPVTVSKGQYVLVNVFGKVVCAQVVKRYKKQPSNYLGNINTIVGVGFMLEDLEQPQEIIPPTLFQRIINSI